MYKKKENILEKINLEINYEDFIRKDNEKTIIILHWWGGSSRSWLTVWELLFQNGFNVIIPDLPGFWKTKLEKIFDLDEYASVVESFIKELWLTEVVLWWHSNGWAISIKIANRWKVKISRLILNNSAWIRNDRNRNIKRKVLSFIIKPLKFFKKIPGFIKLRELFYRAIWGQDYLNAEKNPFLKETYLNIIKSDISDELTKIKENTLLIWGRDDKYTPIRDWIIMRNKIKLSKMIILDKEKHGIHLTSPEKLVNTFLNNI